MTEPMKTMKWMFMAILIITQLPACNAPSSDAKKASAEKQITENNGVQVYYFHYTRRCTTCNNVEIVTKQALVEYYGVKVPFTSVNLDEAASESLAKKLTIEGQTLLIVSGEKKFDLTNDAFLNVNGKPEKLKALLKQTIDPIL
jgi:hypothetical protein